MKNFDTWSFCMSLLIAVFFSFFCYGPSDKFYNIFKMLRLNFAHLSYTYMDFLMIREKTVLIYFDYINELLIMDVACMPRIAQWLLPT